MIDTYPEDRLYEEVAFIAYHFGWSREEIMALPHEERKRWCEEISTINEEMNESPETTQSSSSSSGGVTLSQPIDFDS